MRYRANKLLVYDYACTLLTHIGAKFRMPMTTITNLGMDLKYERILLHNL